MPRQAKSSANLEPAAGELELFQSAGGGAGRRGRRKRAADRSAAVRLSGGGARRFRARADTAMSRAGDRRFADYLAGSFQSFQQPVRMEERVRRNRILVTALLVALALLWLAARLRIL